MFFSEIFCCKAYRKNELRRSILIAGIFIFIVLLIIVRLGAKDYFIHVPALKVDEKDAQAAFANIDDGEKKKVIIIGGGASGLYAGYVLQYLGVGDQVEILEANPTSFGGRVREIDSKDFDVGVPLDMGAEWIHGHPRILKDLLLFNKDKQTNSGDDSGTQNDNNDDTSSSLPQTVVYDPQTFKTYFKRRQRTMNWARHFYAEYKFYNTTWFDYLNRFIYPYVAYNVQLDAAVTTIDTTDEQSVQVTLHDGRVVEADYVIVATPVSQLQGEEPNIQFLPPVPAKKKQAWESIYFAPGLKVWIEFDEKFYPDIQLLGRRVTALGGDTVYFDALLKKDEYNKDRHVLAYLGVDEGASHLLNEAAKKVNNNNGKDGDVEQALFELMMEQLDKIYDGQATKHYVQHYVKVWSNDPYIGGAYTYNFEDITQNLMTNLQAPIAHNRVYFCGEYTHYYDTATVHGAALSGRQAVEKLIRDHAA